MALRHESNSKLPIGLAALIAVQVFCVLFFVADVIEDYRNAPAEAGLSMHLNVEALATLSLLAAIVVEVRYLHSLLRRKAQLEKAVQTASAAVHEVIEAHFRNWRLSPSETDVATFLVKGLDIPEIAHVRGCAEGTVKAHLNAIYRKSGTRNRGELLSVIIDSLLVARA
jgi:DNA-binding NarL/FixJ family response regulator